MIRIRIYNHATKRLRTWRTLRLVKTVQLEDGGIVIHTQCNGECVTLDVSSSSLEKLRAQLG